MPRFLALAEAVEDAVRDGDAIALEGFTHLIEIGVLEIDHDVPAELGDARGDPLHHVLRRRIDQPLDEVEAHALDAGAVELLVLRVGEALVDESDALGLAV